MASFVEGQSHSIHFSRHLLADSSGWRLSTVMKLFLDLSLLFGQLWPKSGCLLSVSYLCFCVLAWMSLLVSGGAIPADL